jgi:hypothetical protein
MVRVRVSLMLRSISSASGILLCEVLAHAVVDDDLVVDREAHDGEDCRGRREVEFEPHQSEEADCLNVAGLSRRPIAVSEDREACYPIDLLIPNDLSENQLQ